MLINHESPVIQHVLQNCLLKTSIFTNLLMLKTILDILDSKELKLYLITTSFRGAKTWRLTVQPPVDTVSWCDCSI